MIYLNLKREEASGNTIVASDCFLECCCTVIFNVMYENVPILVPNLKDSYKQNW